MVVAGETALLTTLYKEAPNCIAHYLTTKCMLPQEHQWVLPDFHIQNQESFKVVVHMVLCHRTVLAHWYGGPGGPAINGCYFH